MNALPTVSPSDVEGGFLSLEELAELATFTPAELGELIEYGALVPIPSATQARAFTADWVGPLGAVCRLRADFDLDLFTVAMVLGYLHRIETLEQKVQALGEQLDARD